MKRKLSIYSFILMSFVLLNWGCSKSDDNTTPAKTPTPATITDIDGNVYHTVTIGSQVWLKENLKVSRYRNGDSIPNITNSTIWNNLSTGACCSYDNSTTMLNTYGYLYNWFAVIDSRKICPLGWHVPTLAEVNTLDEYLGSSNNNNGGKLKETGLTHWAIPNGGATNSTGFTALPGGRRFLVANGFFGLGNEGNWWTSSQDVFSSDEASYFTIDYFQGYLAQLGFNKKYGISVRCIKD